MAQPGTAWNDIYIQTVCQACLQTTEINLLSLNFWLSHATIVLHKDHKQMLGKNYDVRKQNHVPMSAKALGA